MWCINLQKNIDNLQSYDSINYEKIFLDSATEIMNQYEFVIGSNHFEFAELEYYFNDKNKHVDSYTHCKDEQKKCGWYVHSKWGNRAGVDLAFGNDYYCGGILIRGIIDKNTNNTIFGPAKVANFLAEEFFNSNSSHDLQQKLDTLNLNLIVDKECKIYHSTRIGLNDKYKYFKDRLYRFVRQDCLIDSTGKPNFKEKSKLSEISNHTIGLEAIFKSKKEAELAKKISQWQK